MWPADIPIWPAYMAVCVLLLGVTWFTDRTAFVGLLTVLCGLLAMRIGGSFPPLFALTVWSVAAAIIISTNQSIVAGFLAVIVAACYLPACLGAPWLVSAFWSDVAGVLLLVSLMAPTVGDRVLSDRGWPKYLASGDLPAWPASAFGAMARAQKNATTEALEHVNE